MKFAVRLLAALSLLSALGHSQTLAHKGWAGSGLTLDPWWQGALFYADPTPNLPALTTLLPSFESNGIDALILTPPPIAAAQDDFDTLEADAVRHHIRILVDLPFADDMASTARFWLSRGVAGLRIIPTSTGASPSLQSLHDLHRITAAYPGHRILLWDAGPPPTPRPHLPDAELTTDPFLQTLASLPSALSGPTAGVALAAGPVPTDPALARLLLTALLTSRGAPILQAGPQSDEAWLQKLTTLHHNQPALHTGSLQILPSPDPALILYLRRPRLGGVPVLIMLNTTSRTLVTSLAPTLRRLGLNNLKTLATTAPESTPQTPSSISLGPYGILLAELRKSPGLETVVLPRRRGRR